MTTAKPKLPPTPRGLSAKAQRLWRETTSTFVLEDHHLALLEQAARCLSRIEEAEKIIAEKGLLLPDRWGVLKRNPACDVEDANRRLLKSYLRELQLDVVADAEQLPRLPRTGRKRG